VPTKEKRKERKNVKNLSVEPVVSEYPVVVVVVVVVVVTELLTTRLHEERESLVSLLFGYVSRYEIRS
jgi:hypothetical protein